ncbi:hypothetical protein B0T24DRAFT_724142 [Lasiosphaeria ovina]|uniref:Fucose-specific lectin n=1 Tax=Lasiosphaeria ovina TaxID=92902 RepID=A0AAE0JVS9_9PEZI|nr:hypothetical protein B0T24DRAFT_724142 [Lasiosphaeria ovina]
MAFSVVKKLLVLAAAVSPAQAAIAAWWNGIAPQIILQNQTTGQIRYSACNSYGQPVYSYTDSSFLSLNVKARNDTPLAGSGYWDTKKTIASIYYLDEFNNIVNALFNCNMATGLFTRVGTWNISAEAPSVNNNTGLSALLLGSTGGYRLYFHDRDMAINEIGYTPTTGWKWNGIVNRAVQSSPAIHAAFSNQNNISVVAPFDDNNIGVTRFGNDSVWRLSTFPKPLNGNVSTNLANVSIAINQTVPANFSLSAYYGKPRGIGISIDHVYSRFVYYIGNDTNLYQLSSKNWVWSPQTNQSNAFWPKADSPNAELAVASDFDTDMVRIYYMVKNQLTEVKYDNGAWKAWSPVAGPRVAVTTTSTPEPPANTTAAEPATDTPEPTAPPSEAGLSKGAQAGIGVGVSLGVIALIAFGAACILLRRKRDPETPVGALVDPDAPVPPYNPHPQYNPPFGSPISQSVSPVYDNSFMWEKNLPPTPQPIPIDRPVYQLDPANHPTEMYAPQRPLYELPEHSYSHELMGSGQAQYPVSREPSQCSPEYSPQQSPQQSPQKSTSRLYQQEHAGEHMPQHVPQHIYHQMGQQGHQF